ncbi:dynein regulatory complex subunit 6-like [Mercenaria mercenaria]|uniref:dynein regulatory complex subunit 6-like n=1 Tax=Mercenaria mercenaria TaxID=6596 RepID=UPI00234EA280|nr:dynein regulatory complex subunit 6-like [Mercenaria mercenaria]XP_045193897.2 dynein regulatory complex subunit 6-like [Mercenaria mercenaria]XP_045193906.2 dynein regulatory complex subunit 6-like [Mercenaria mercenaria]XP_053380839.1 dynein regulatory complex subunit 6-like [Mercenaria mercenaria]
MESDKTIKNSCDKSKTTEFNINRKIFVGNISYRVKSRKLTKFFSKFGPVEYCYIAKDHIKKWSRGIAFVTFKDEESMQRALQASEEELFFDERQMRVKPAELSTKATYWQNRHKDDDDDDSDVEEEMEHHSDVDHTTDQSQVNPDTPSMIDSLFDDVLLRIFSLLSWKERIGVERVCWRWKHLVQRTWASEKHLHFQNIFRQFQGLTDEKLNSVLLRCGQYLESLDLSASPRLLTDFTMDIIGKYCPEIKELDLSAITVTDVSLRNLVSRCTNLHKVKLKRCLHVSDKGVNTILTSGQPLSHLDLTDVSQLTGKCFKTLQCDLDSLKNLVLINCCKVNDSSFNNLVCHSRNLEELYINNCRGLSGVALREICQNCSHLRVFHAAGVKFDTDALEGLKKLSILEELNLSLCQMVTDVVLVSVSEHCKRLRYIDVSGCHAVTDLGVKSLSQLSQLNSINISYLNQVTEDSVIKLAQVGNLVKFVARATTFPSDDVITELVTLCPRLNHIDLSGCFQVTNKMFEGFRNRPESNKTVDLVLGGTSVDWLSDDVDWIKTGIIHLNVSMYNFAIDDLRADRDIVLPSYDEENWDDEIDEYPPHPPLSAYQQDHVEMCNDWCDDDDDYDDDFLDNDDPLEYERWNMS